MNWKFWQDRHRINYEILGDSGARKNSVNDDQKTTELIVGGMKTTQGDAEAIFGKIISELRKKTDERKELFKLYKEALRDPIIGQAVEMMADDATQFDVDRERTIWVQAKDKNKDKAYVDALNHIIESYVEPFIDTVASGVVAYGEFIFDVQTTKSKKTSRYENTLVLMPRKHIENIYHFMLENEEQAYAEIKESTEQDAGKIYDNFEPFTKFLHFINTSLENSKDIKIKVRKDGKEITKKAYLLQGESIITERILETWKILRTLENALIQTRLAKSKIVRIVNVDVTSLSDNSKAQNIVDYIHNSIVVNENIDPASNQYSQTSMQAEPVIITVPVKNGVGKVSIEEFTMDANISEIADVDYFLNKLFAGLRIPKLYFDYSEALPGVGAGASSLAKTDIRYSRAVKKIQRVLVWGIKSMIRIFNAVNGIKDEDAPKVSVHIVKVNSAEDEERYMELEQRLSTANTMIDSFYDPTEGGIDQEKLEIYIKFFEEAVPAPEMVSFLKSLQTDIKSAPDGLKFKV